MEKGIHKEPKQAFFVNFFKVHKCCDLLTYLVVAFGRSDAFLTSYRTRTRLKTTTWGRYLKSSYSEMCLSAISQLKTHNMCTYLLI